MGGQLETESALGSGLVGACSLPHSRTRSGGRSAIGAETLGEACGGVCS
jgi:hypothetical protein